MNGVCCLWQMEEENERQVQQRDAIRRDIRVEYERQRHIEQQIWIERQQKHASGASCQAENWYSGDAASVHTDRRRRKLLAAKQKLALQQQSPKGRHGSDSSSQGSRHSQRRHAAASSEARQGPGLVQQVPSPRSRQPIKKRKVRVPSPVHHRQSPTKPQGTPPPPMKDCYAAATVKSPMSSLMDSAFDEEDDDDDDGDTTMMLLMEEEVTSLVDVPLR